MIEIKHVTKQYGKEVVLQNVSMTIDAGLHFIVGASGSGKTTLLRIISGIEQDYEGEVRVQGTLMNGLSQKDRAVLNNQVLGIVWQDFHLLEHHSANENIQLPQYLREQKQSSEKLLKELKISRCADQRVSVLSGGQKQRVAIAKEIAKNPDILLLDEPTSALDTKTKNITMRALRNLSKYKTVVIVTHDTSLITEKDKVYELDKGELIQCPIMSEAQETVQELKKPIHLSLVNAFQLAKTSLKHALTRFLIASLTICMASVCLYSVMGDVLGNESERQFQELYDTYGDSLTDIGLYHSFTNASGTDDTKDDRPNGDVTQDIKAVYERYQNDGRIEFLTYIQAFDNIHIMLGKEKYAIQNSGNTPLLNSLIAGEMPKADKNEVLVPKSFLNTSKQNAAQLIGQEIEFQASISDRTTGEPIAKKVAVKATISGIIDTTVKYEYEGKMQSYTIEDSFLFSKQMIEDMRAQAGMESSNVNFMMRAKTPADMIEIKDELNEQGIVPLGNFELVEDIVRLQSQSNEQSVIGSILIVLISIVGVAAVFIITGLLRKKEIAIYKISGYAPSNIRRFLFAETIFCMLGAFLLVGALSLVESMIGGHVLMMPIRTFSTLMILIAIVCLVSLLSFLITTKILEKVDIAVALKKGEGQ